ncbi:MAG: sugar ABC transporter substrate-binding protein [Desulfobacterales bacterium]|nr:MAG: sugar ABC transporter substrate-binding protein [Desulfobacterales bacterium]
MLRRRMQISVSTAVTLGFLLWGLNPAVQAGNPYEKFKGTTIVVNFPAHAHYDAAMTVIPEFTQQTGIKVEVDKLQYMRMHEKQLLEMSKPQGDYDLISYVCMWKTEYVNKGLLTPLAPFITNAKLADPNYDFDDLIPAYVGTTGLVGGKKGYQPGVSAALYGIPFGSETSILAYRKDIFDKYGLKAPETYDDMLQAARVIKEKESGMYGVTSRGASGHQVGHAWLLHLTPFGGEVFDDNWEPAFHKEPSLKAIGVLKEIVETGPPGIPSFGFSEMMNSFLQGQAAMWLDSTAIAGMVRNPKVSKIEGKVAYTLHPKGVVRSSETGGFGIAIPANSQNKEAAFLFMQWLTSKEQDKQIALAGGHPCRLSTLRDSELRKVYPEFAVFEEQLQYANPDWRPIIPEWPEVEVQNIGIGLSEAITGKKTPQEAMQQYVEPVRKIMERAGYYTWRK